MYIYCMVCERILGSIEPFDESVSSGFCKKCGEEFRKDCKKQAAKAAETKNKDREK